LQGLSAKSSAKVIRALFAPFFPLFMRFYIIGTLSNQKALFLKKSSFGEILGDPEFFCSQCKIQGVMPIQNVPVRLSEFQVCFRNIFLTT